MKLAFGVGDSLSVRISARTGDFERGINSAERSLTSLVDNSAIASSALQVLAGRADEAGDEISQAGRKATVTGGLFSALSVSTEGLSLSFGSLSSVLVLSLIPALAALASTLVPLVATLGALTAGATALAGAFGAIVGSGIIAFGAKRGEQNRERLMEVNARIEQLEALQETEAGLTDTQEEQLEKLEERQKKLEEQTGVMGGLKSAISDLVAEIKPMIVEFGQRFIPLIEDAVAAIPLLVRNILDALGGFSAFERALRNAGNTAMQVIPGMVAGMMDLARRALPQLIQGAQWLMQNGPSIFNGMMQTAREVGPDLLNITQAVIAMIPKINQLGIFIINNLLPAFNKGSKFAGQFAPQISKIVTEIKKMLPFVLKIGKQILSVAVPAFKAFLTIAGNVLGWFNSLETWQKKGIITAIAAAIGILGGPISALGAAVVIAANHWDFFVGVIDSVHSALESLWNFLTDNPIVNTLGNIAGFVGETLSVTQEQRLAGSNMNPRSGFGPMGNQNQNTNVQVEVKGDTSVIQDVTARTINDRERRTNRNTGRRPQPTR